VRSGEASASEPLMKCRNAIDDVKTGGRLAPGISSGAVPKTARATSGT
jgi:hypothetical protein